MRNTSTDKLLALRAELDEELRRRGVVRSSNIVGDYGEWIVCERFGWTMADSQAQKSYDCTAANGTRYQVKTRHITSRNPSRQLGVIRSFDFGYLVAIILGEDYGLQEIWQFPVDFVQKYGSWSKAQAGWITRCKPPMTTDEAAVELTNGITRSD
ncbi:MAG: hypothetical protein NXH85_11880 [Pseudomonadaceae bacterium]|nr:hypothetical protein [Pseudomonadaceae bacterium]